MPGVDFVLSKLFDFMLFFILFVFNEDPSRASQSLFPVQLNSKYLVALSNIGIVILSIVDYDRIRASAFCHCGPESYGTGPLMK